MSLCIFFFFLINISFNCIFICSRFFKVEQDWPISETSPHIANIGRMVEDMENKIRNTLNEIYFGKTKDIVNGLRSVQTLADQRQQAALRQDLAAALQRRNANN